MTMRQVIAMTIDKDGVEPHSIVDNVDCERKDGVVPYPSHDGHRCRIHNKEEMRCYYFVVDDVAVVASFDQEQRLLVTLELVSVPITTMHEYIIIK
jgi:hypothetical protein